MTFSLPSTNCFFSVAHMPPVHRVPQVSSRLVFDLPRPFRSLSTSTSPELLISLSDLLRISSHSFFCSALHLLLFSCTDVVQPTRSTERSLGKERPTAEVRCGLSAEEKPWSRKFFVEFPIQHWPIQTELYLPDGTIDEQFKSIYVTKEEFLNDTEKLTAMIVDGPL